MSKWPLNGMNPRIVVALFLLISIGMCGAAAAAPHITNVQLNITPKDICEQNTVCITFHLVTSMQEGNGFYVWLDPNLCLRTENGTELRDCINITYEGATSPFHPSEVIVYKPGEYPEFVENCSPYGAGCLVKMWLPQYIPNNKNVTICFGDCVDPTCPCFCSGYRVWVSNDFDPCAWLVSNTVHMDVRVEGVPGPGGSIQTLPDGEVHTTNFTDYYQCMAEASYKIKADPCKIISNITITPICPQVECIDCTPAGYICPCDLNPDCIDDYIPLADQKLTEYIYNFTDLRCCYQLWAQFENKTCNVTAQPGPNGGILSPDGIWAYYPGTHSREFYCGEVGCYLIKPNISYSIENITVNGDEQEFELLPNGSAILCYESDCNDTIIGANFTMSPVDAFLWYQLPKDQCGAKVEVQVMGMNNITQMVEFADDLFLGGNSSVFNINGSSSGTFFGGYNSGFIAGSPYPSGDSPEVDVISAGSNPETYKVTYNSTSLGTSNATVTILSDGTTIWAPSVPSGMTEIINIEALMPAWQLVTQDFLDCNPDWEGPVGLVIYVADGTYHETFEVDTPGVHLKAFPGASPVIDASGQTPVGPGPTGAVFLSAGCTGIEGFTIKLSDTNGLLVWPSSEKCANTSIHDCQKICEGEECWLDCDVLVPCCKGRINVVDNMIFDNDENGIRVIDAVVLINGNEIYNNDDDGIDAGCLFCGVECIDPEAITHSPVACSEIIYNTIYGNGPSGKGEWEVDGHFTNDPTACGELEGWTDAGIQIRCVGSAWCDSEPCCECEPPCECIQRVNGVHDLVGQGQEPCGGCDQHLYIVHNTVSENEHAGIYLMEGATQGGNITIQANHLTDNGIFGMLTDAALPCRIDFKWNDIVGNGYWGVKNRACCDLVAKENYWGEPGGPSEGPAPIVQCIECRCHEEDQRSDALGNGDAVSHRVHYNPWLYTSSADIFHESSPTYMIRAFGSDSLELQKGWNTLSVPCSLLSSYNSIPEIAHVDTFSSYNEGLGEFLYVIETSPGVYDSNFDLVLAWNTTTGYWDNIGADQTALTNLKPGLGYYIRMKEPSRFPILYSDVIGLPAVPLDDGWNLIGAPWGIDREKDCCAEDQGRWGVASPDAGDPEAFKPVWEALESIKEGNGGTKGVAIVVSPSVPGQISIWSASVTSGFWDPIYNNKEMATGEGYWVFMVNPATYGGFEITPFYYT